MLGGERFLREIRLTAQLQHPHILNLLDSGEAGGFLFYVMPYIEGESLRERLTKEGQLPVEELWSLSVAEARRRLGLPEGGVAPEMYREMPIQPRLAAALRDEWRGSASSGRARRPVLSGGRIVFSSGEYSVRSMKTEHLRRSSAGLGKRSWR